MHIHIHAKWLSNAVRAAGRDVGSGLHFIDKVTGKIEKDISKIPFAGPLFVAILDLEASPYTIGIKILEGKNIAKTLVSQLRSDLKDVKEIAPYAQMVISLVPDVGPVVSGAISAGVALAEGQPIDDVLIAGIKGAVPGGPLGAAAFGAAVGAVTAIANKEPLAEGVTRSLLDAIPLTGTPQVNDAIKRALTTAVNMTGAIARGENPGTAAITAIDQNLASLKDLPGMSETTAKVLQVSLGTGMAMVMGGRTQKAVSKAITPAVLDELAAIGQKLVAGDATVAVASKSVPNGLRGFTVGVGLMTHQLGINSFASVRDTLKGDDCKAFDIAVSLHVGRVTTTPASANPAVAAGAAIANGVRGASKDNTVAILKAVTADAQMKAGVEQAVSSIPTVSPRMLATGAGIATMGVLGIMGMGALPVLALGSLAAGAAYLLGR